MKMLLKHCNQKGKMSEERYIYKIYYEISLRDQGLPRAACIVTIDLVSTLYFGRNGDDSNRHFSHVVMY